MGAEARLAELKIQLPAAPKPLATYLTAVRHNDLVYVSGHIAFKPDGTIHVGKLGADLDVAAGREAARECGLAILATLRAHLGTLDRVVRPIKVTGMVNCTPDFIDHPKVINGFSELLVEVFGEDGKAARSAVGMPSLPGGVAVEIEAIFQIRD